MNKTKKSLLLSALSLLLCISMLIGSTFAWFTDSVTSAGNKIQSGTLKVDLELLDKETSTWNSLKESQAPIFNYDKWEPGYIDTKILKVENEGNLALKWVAKFYSEKQLSILADVIDVYVCPSADEIAYPTNRNLEGYACVGNLRTFINSLEETTKGTLQPNEVSYLGIALKMREEAGNEYQGLSLGDAFDIRIYATQYTSESDSFGNQYDANAEEPVLVSRSGMLQEGQGEVGINLFHKGSKLLSVNVPEEALEDPTQPVTVKIDSIDPETTIYVDENTKVVAYDIEVTNLKKNLGDDQLVTVVLAAPRGLPAVKVYHKDEEIKDVVYDAVAGTVTFKTGSFSPYAVAYTEFEVNSLTDLRAAVGTEGATIKLTGPIEINLSKEREDRSPDHMAVGKYYNAVNIGAQNVTIDLNGNSITVSCGDAYNSNSDVGALFYVAEGGSLQIKNSGAVETGFIKMKNSVYAVWAPHKNYSVDIYGGTFIADSYAGDPLHLADKDTTDSKMPNENSCRALIYAGKEGRINVYGGYFLYNNTPNDDLDRNNGAFNAKDFCDEELITIHDGVMLINGAFRQDPTHTSRPDGTYDNNSIKLEGTCTINQITLDTPIKIGDREYATWYQVQRTSYDLIFKDNGGNTLDTVTIPFTEGKVTVDAKDDTAFGRLTGDYANYFDGWVNAASNPVTTISEDNKNDIVLYPTMKDIHTIRWLDENGNVYASVTTTAKTYGAIEGKPATTPTSATTDMEFDHWETREKGTDGKVTYTKVDDNTQITGDMTLYPFYDYKAGDGSINLVPHDEDGDGRPEYYTVEQANGLKDQITIPGYVNGVPVKAITDLSDADITESFGQLLGADGITAIIIKDGVKEIGSDAFANSPKLKEVTIPASVEKIGANAFSSNAGAISNKVVTINYAGTWAEWQKICGGADNNDANWDSGLQNGSQVICTDPETGTVETYVLNETDWFGKATDHTWQDWTEQ